MEENQCVTQFIKENIANAYLFLLDEGRFHVYMSMSTKQYNFTCMVQKNSSFELFALAGLVMQKGIYCY